MAAPFASLLLLLPLAAAIFDCPATPYDVKQGCYQQLFTTVGASFDCTLTFTGDPSRNNLLSLEAINMGPDDLIQVSSPLFNAQSSDLWGDTSSAWSVQQFFYRGNNSDFTLHIKTAATSQMQGTFVVCPYEDWVSITRNEVTVSYGQEGFLLQQFTPEPPAKTNFGAPTMWVVTAQTQVALISAAYEMGAPYCENCLNNIWIYEGAYEAASNMHAGEFLKFIGTAEQVKNKLWTSTASSVTLYFVNEVLGNDFMAVIANEKKNLEKCATSSAFFYSNNFGSAARYNLQAKEGGGDCLTILNECYYNNICDGPTLYVYLNDPDQAFLAYAGVAHPSPVESGLLLMDLMSLDSDSLPQQLQGNARTFYVSKGNASLNFYGTTEQLPRNGRKGFFKTNFYPFPSTDTWGGSLPLSRATYSYNITLTVTDCDFPSGEGTLSFSSDVYNQLSITVDRNTNVNRSFTFTVPPQVPAQATLMGGTSLSKGGIATFEIIALDTPTSDVTSQSATSSTPTPAPSTISATTGTSAEGSAYSTTTNPISGSPASQSSSTTPRLQSTTTSGSVGRGISVLMLLAVGVLRWGA